MEILRLENVSCIYGAKTPFEIKALDGVTVGFEKGKVTGVIGHTGSGKSTLVSMLNGLLKPTEGKVILDGKDIWEKPKEIGKVRHRVGLVMQYPEYQLFDETVRADIGYAPRNMKLSEKEIAERVDEAAHFVGLREDILDKSPLELSGGQKRRAALAGIIAMRPEILVLDEPAAGLDPRGKAEIFEGLLKYRDAFGATVIIVSHSMEDMAKYCENIVVMKGARLLKTGTVAEIFSEDHLLTEAGLNTPLAYKLSKELSRRGIRLSGELYTVEGVARAVTNALKEK